MAGTGDVRIEETLKIKIGEAKNLPAHILPSLSRNTYCILKLDREEIFRTHTVEKSLSPFYGEEFQGEIPKKFRQLSVYLYEQSGHKSDKVIGKVCLKKNELHKFSGKEQWFPLEPVDADSEVQGKVSIELRFDEYLNTDPEGFSSHRMAVRVIECSDLTVTNGACNPYAVVSLTRRKSRHKDEVKRTTAKKKTICPHFDETFFFNLENRGQNHDRTGYYIEDIFNAELSISLWHDDSRVVREMLGSMYPGVFLGEVRLPLTEIDTSTPHKAWYVLQRRCSWKQAKLDLGSLRLCISYVADHVFSSQYYDDLRNLILQSSDIHPISSSAACILGEIVDSLHDAARPLMKIFLLHEKMVPLVKALVQQEMNKTSDPHTLFRGNTLLTKIIDEMMKFVGLPYLKDTLKSVINEICVDHKPCEIDAARLKDGESLEENTENLTCYVEKIFQAIINSGLICPKIMCEIFYTLKEEAFSHFPERKEVKYQVVSGFVFLRFFAPAILGPRLFDLTSDVLDGVTSRTLTLISKTIQGLGNLVSSKTLSFGLKEDYMVPLFQALSDSSHVDALKMFLDIISTSSVTYSKQLDTPIILKEGYLIKRAQGRKMFGVKNFKKRFLCLTNYSLYYSKLKGDLPLCEIKIEDILAVERVQEESFKMKYMFQVIQPERTLYIQAANCVEEKEWLDLLNKVCTTNRKRLKLYHPAAYINGHWLCCKSQDSGIDGCTPVTGGIPLTEIQLDIDSDREVERIHSLFLSHMEKLEAMQDNCASQEVYVGETEIQENFQIEDTKSCFVTLNSILRCVIGLEQEHNQHRRLVQQQTVIGSIDAPIGDESFVSLNTKL